MLWDGATMILQNLGDKENQKHYDWKIAFIFRNKNLFSVKQLSNGN